MTMFLIATIINNKAVTFREIATKVLCRGDLDFREILIEFGRTFLHFSAFTTVIHLFQGSEPVNRQNTQMLKLS